MKITGAIRVGSLASALVLSAGCGGASNKSDAGEASPTVKESKGLQVTTSAFEPGGAIPARYTCDDTDLSPELRWSGAPDNAAAFAIVCYDPDAPGGDWVHWVAYNIPPTINALAEGFTDTPELDDGTR